MCLSVSPGRAAGALGWRWGRSCRELHLVWLLRKVSGDGVVWVGAVSAVGGKEWRWEDMTMFQMIDWLIMACIVGHVQQVRLHWSSGKIWTADGWLWAKMINSDRDPVSELFISLHCLCNLELPFYPVLFLVLTKVLWPERLILILFPQMILWSAEYLHFTVLFYFKFPQTAGVFLIFHTIEYWPLRLGWRLGEEDSGLGWGSMEIIQMQQCQRHTCWFMQILFC